MNLLPTDLIVRLNEDTRQVTFWVCPKDKPQALLRFYAINIDDYESVDLLANELGTSFAAFLASVHKNIFPDSKPGGVTNQSDSEDASFDEARLLIDRITDNSKIEDLEGIDALLESAATKGDVKAIKYLQNTWPKMREIFVRRIKR